MSSNWINHSKQHAKAHNMSYNQALSDPNNRINYHNSQAINNGLPYQPVRSYTTDHSGGYNPNNDTRYMNQVANLAKTYNVNTKKK